MMRRRISDLLLVLLALAVLLGGAGRAGAKLPEAAKVREATEVLQAFTRIPEQGIPAALLREAQALVVIPGAVKLGFMVAGRFGQGVMLVRSEDGSWGLPFMVRLAGGSFGWQMGLQATDLVLVFKSGRGIESVRNGKLTLGADASVAVGPVGRSFEAATDLHLKSEIYSYSKSKGVFAGLALEGSVLQPDRQATEALYGRPADRIPDKDTKIPPVVERFRRTVEKLSLGKSGPQG